LSLFKNEKLNFYWSAFGNFNAAKMEKNYIVINNVQYNIIHSSNINSNSKPGGTGYGVGSGLGFKYNLTNNILVDLTYNLYYNKIKMTDDINAFGIQNELLFRLLWTK